MLTEFLGRYYEWQSGLNYRKIKIDKEEITSLVSSLIKLQEQTHPDRGISSDVEKDLFAEIALRTAALLLSHTVRWAIMHEVGKALSGTPSAVFRYSTTLTNDQVQAIMRAGSHEHEISGASWPGDDPAVARRAVAAVLEHVLGFWRPAEDLVKALHALDVGEVRPILASSGKGRHGPAYTLRELRLKGLAYIEFRRGCGDSEEDARHEVATAFGVAPETVSTWRKRLPVEEERNQDRLVMARTAGETLRRMTTRAAPEPGDENLRWFFQDMFGTMELARAASEHRRALARGKRSRPKR